MTEEAPAKFNKLDFIYGQERQHVEDSGIPPNGTVTFDNATLEKWDWHAYPEEPNVFRRILYRLGFEKNKRKRKPPARHLRQQHPLSTTYKHLESD